MKAVMSNWLRRRDQTTACSPIGVEFSADALYMVQCESSEEAIRIRAATSVSYGVSRDELLNDRKALRGFVRKALGTAPFVGRKVHTSLPANEVRIVPLSVAVSGTQTEQAAVIKSLKEKLRSDLSNEVVDYLHVRNAAASTSETNVLAAVASRDVVWGHLRTIESAGLEPMSVDVGPAALTRLLAHMPTDDPEKSVLLINFGLEKTYITVVWGRRLMLDREVPFGQLSLISKLASALDVDIDIARTLLQRHRASTADTDTGHIGKDAVRIIDEVLHPQFAVLAEEVSRTLVYIASKTHGGSTNGIYLNGSLAHYPYIQMRMQDLFNVPVTLLNPLARFSQASAQAFSKGLQPTAGFSLATGLALRD